MDLEGDDCEGEQCEGENCEGENWELKMSLMWIVKVNIVKGRITK